MAVEGVAHLVIRRHVNILILRSGMTERARLMYEYHTRARIAANPIPVCKGMPFFYWRK